MSRYRTAEEVKKFHIEVMGNDLGSLYHALWNELSWLYSKWEEYVELFGTKPSRIDLVNKAAAHFFRIVQDSLWENSLLHIARLTDSPRSAGKENLTIRKLPLLINNENLKDNVSFLVDVAINKAEFCRDWRNRHIAHKGLGLALHSGVEPLKPANRAKVKESLSAISSVLNAVSLHYMNSTTEFEGVGDPDGVVALLYVLDDGLRLDEERRKRLKVGKFSADDYQIRDL